MAVKKPKKYRVKRIIIIGTIVAVVGGAAFWAAHKVSNKPNEEQTTSSVSTTYETDEEDAIEETTNPSYEDEENTEPEMVVENPYDDDYSFTGNGIFANQDFFGNMKSYYEYSDNKELNDIIDQIKAVNYVPSTQFKESGFYNSPVNELKKIQDVTSTLEDYVEEKQYDWYLNGRVDSDVLINKLTYNCKTNGIEITDDLQVVIEEFAKNLQPSMDYIKSRNSDYDFTITLSNIDKLLIKDVDDFGPVGNYDYTNNNMSVDYSASSKAGTRKFYVIHNIFKVLENQTTTRGDFYVTSINIDTPTTTETPLFLDFMSDSFNESFTQESAGMKFTAYKSADDKIDMITASTGVSYQDLSTIYITSNHRGLMQAFEPELQNVNLVFSTLEGLDFGCGYGSVPAGYDEISYTNDAYASACVNLLKNGYIRCIKDLKVNDKSYDEVNEELLKMQQVILNNKYFSFSKEAQESVDACVGQLNTIFYSANYSI